jgi:phage gpG-like protein
MDLQQLEEMVQKVEEIPSTIDLKQPLGEIRDYVWQETKKNFDAESSPDGVPWPELAESTKKRKKRQARQGRGSLKKLVETGVMKEAVTGDSPGAVNETTPTSWEGGVNVVDERGKDYPPIHDQGGPVIPQREFMGLTDAMQDKIADIAAEHVLKEVERVFG